MDAKLFPKWMGTVWGSDILYYRNIPNHLVQIKQLLSSLDIFSCECKRDIDFARELGFTGVFSPVMPDAGSVDISNLKQWRDLIVPSKRRIILLRGYQSFSGRALTALDALEICQERLHGYRILVYSASNEVKQRVKELSLSTSIDIHILTHITPYAMLRLFARARLFIGISISDGISRSMIEAMAMGAFPIQTDTSCCEEWIIDGVNGYSVPVDDIEVISEKIQSALANNAMVDNASRMNLAIIDERLNNETLTRHALEFYRASLGLC
jgi:glycosyltransferase involved in cell wall biosynthesis